MTNCRFEDQDMLQNASNSQLEDSEAIKKTRTRKPKVKKRSANTSDLCANLTFDSKMEGSILTMLLPIRTVSEANCTQHWQKKHKRHKLQKKIVFFEILPFKYLLRTPCKIHYIRYAPGTLDRFENLPMSLKYINDQVCAEITGDYRPGRADSNKDITISCDQVKSKQYAVKIIIENI